MTIVGLAYVAFLLLSLAGMTLRSIPLQLVGSASGFVLAVLLFLLFAPADPLIALALLPLAFIHYVIQGVGQVRADAGTLRLALVPFAAYLMVLGYLIARSTLAPVALGVLIALAGLLWLIAVVPRVPTWSTLAVVLFGVVAEIALAMWLLMARRERIQRPRNMSIGPHPRLTSPSKGRPGRTRSGQWPRCRRGSAPAPSCCEGRSNMERDQGPGQHEGGEPADDCLSHGDGSPPGASVRVRIERFDRSP